MSEDLKPLVVLSLGAGVQSSTLALMAAHGEVTPMPDAAIFADTQAEPQSVYRWLDWLEKQLPFPVYRVSRGSLTEESLEIRTFKDDPTRKWVKSLLPCHIANPDGTKGMMGRQCTYSYKLEQLEKAKRKLAGIKRGQKTLGVVTWIGISLDEVYRMKPARQLWDRNQWPLVDKRMRRSDCLRWMEAHSYPVPPRSSCIYCPFHSDAEWARLQREEPKAFSEAVRFERALQTVKSQSDNQDGVPYLHASLRPLDEVDFRTDFEKGQLSLFGNECEGMCGV